MSPDEFIAEAIAAGERDGVAALNAGQRLVFLISEAEVLSDMEGVDAFLRRYAPMWLSECAAGFEAVGATEIAAGFRTLPPDVRADSPLLDRLNELITNRTGYDYEAIRRAVADSIPN
jgi:hypothetical protein